MIDSGNTARNLRLGLDLAAASHQLRADSWTQIERRLVSRPRRRVAIAAVAAAVAAVMVVAATVCLRQQLSGPAPRSAIRPPSQQLKVASRLHFSHFVGPVAAGPGSVWAGGLNVTYRVNPATSQVTMTVPTPGTDEFSWLAIGAGSVWVTGGNRPGYHLGVYRIDLRDNKVTDFVRLPQYGQPGTIAIADRRVWVGSDAGGGSLYRIDPRRSRVTGPPIGLGYGVGAIVPAAGALWVSLTNAGGSILRIAPLTGEVTLPQGAWAKITNVDAAGARSMWMSGNNVIDRVDPATGRITAAIRARGVDWVYFWHGSAWAVMSSAAGTVSIVRVDPATDKVVGKAVALGSGPVAVAAGPAGLWAVTGSNFNHQQLVHLVLRTIVRG